MESLTVVVLAAGQGTRMKSQWPKVLHKVCGVPMAEQVIRTVKKAGSEKCVVVTGFKEELVRERLAGENIYFVHQEEQLGTAHAVMQAVPLFKDNRDGYVLVVCGDTPLLRRETIEGLVCACRDHDGAAAVLTAIMDNPFGYGKIGRASCRERV